MTAEHGGVPSPHPPQSAQEVALAWVDAVMDRGDLSAAWPLTDPTLRLVLAQDWVWTHRHEPAIGHNQDWDEIANALAAASDPQGHALWARFADDVVKGWHQIWRGFSARTWAALDHPEVLALDLEMVTFVETGGGPVPPKPGRTAMVRRFALRHTDDGWAVASINGEQMFVPGWPPTMQKLSG